MELGEVVILIFRQGLWSGNRTEKHLINFHQCRDFDISIYDDPSNQHSPLVIKEYFNTHIPMSTVESTCGFITWYPTDDDIEICQHINIQN